MLMYVCRCPVRRFRCGDRYVMLQRLVLFHWDRTFERTSIAQRGCRFHRIHLLLLLLFQFLLALFYLLFETWVRVDKTLPPSLLVQPLLLTDESSGLAKHNLALWRHRNLRDIFNAKIIRETFMQEGLTEASLTRQLGCLHLLTWRQLDTSPVSSQVVIHTVDQVSLLSLQSCSIKSLVDEILLLIIGFDKISEDLL